VYSPARPASRRETAPAPVRPCRPPLGPPLVRVRPAFAPPSPGRV